MKKAINLVPFYHGGANMKKSGLILLLLVLLSAIGCRQNRPAGIGQGGYPPQENDLDEQLRTLIAEKGVVKFVPGSEPDPVLVTLGQALFFDKLLSGNRDIACATCHHPTEAGGDGLPVSVGTGGTGLGHERQLGQGRDFIPRNAPDIFNRGAYDWTTMFWDSRVFVNADGVIETPAGDDTPLELDSVLAAQALFPVTSEAEMRGAPGDRDVFGQQNELAAMEENDFPAIWQGLMVRILSYPDYVEMFNAAYPDIPVDELGFQHAANAIAAFEIDAFSQYHSPWYAYLEGNDTALTEEAKHGAVLFFGDAGCYGCHSGPLFTDQQHHIIAAPQVGPGKGDDAPLDLGRARETSNEADQFAFRTPPLLNVANTGPWFHDGAYSTLEAAIRHHFDPSIALRHYDVDANLPPELQQTFQSDHKLQEQILENIDPLLTRILVRSDEYIAYLVAFLETLSDPAVEDLEHVIPDTVPSGLPVEDAVNS
jgi:cytochrome c peroxidase